MKPLRILLALIAAATLLAGCRSGKRAAGSPGNYGGSAAPRGHVDYSSEVTDAMGADLAAEARLWLGTPYRYGGADRGGTDCSGLVMELYRSVCATKLPRTTAQQISYCTKVARNKARVGDLMFFGPSRNPAAVSHVGLYIGKGEMIHASSSRGVMVSNVDAGYWGDRFCGVGRVDGAYDSWAAINGVKGKGKGEKAGKDGSAPEPLLVPSPESPVPLPVMEVAYDRLPVSGHHLPLESAPAAPQAANSMASAEVASKGENSASDTPSKAPSPAASIDLLDLIINQKVDSIFADRFMD